MNLVLIVFDTLRQDHLGAYGNEWIWTPNFDAFSREAVTFTRCYPESLPTIPFRRSLHTGKRNFPFEDHRGDRSFPDRWPGWNPIPQNQDTLSEILSKNGYRCGLISDTYHLFEPNVNYPRGFDSWIFIRGQEVDRYRSGPDIPDQEIVKHLNDYAKDNQAVIAFLKKYFQNNFDRKTEEDYFPAKVFKEGARWLMDNQDAENIFLVIDSFDPHEPWDPPVYYRRLYDPDDNVVDHIHSPYFFWKGYLTPRELKRLQANYAGEVTMVDRWFGYFMETLRISGHLNDTVVAVISDHGHNLGYDPKDKGLISKQGHPMTRAVADLVMMIRSPSGQGAGTVCDAIVYSHDLSRTLLHLVGIEPEGIDGKNFWPSIIDKSKKIQDHVTIGWSSLITVINDQWWYNANIWGEGSLLYSLKEDPNLVNNVAEKHPKVCEKMLNFAIQDAGGKIPEILGKYKSKATVFKFADEPYETAARWASLLSDKIRAAQKSAKSSSV